MSDQAYQPADVPLAEGVAADKAGRAALATVRGPGAIRTVLLMAKVTFIEAARRKILWMAAIAGAAFLGLYVTGLRSIQPNVRPSPQEAFGAMTMMVLYAGSMMTALMAALISCDTLSGEIASGTIHAIATKPVDRWCLVLGKWIGFAGMMALYVLYIEGGTMALAWLVRGHATPHAASALGLLWLQTIVLLGVTMLCSTRLSALTSGACTLGLYGLAFMGGWIEQFGAIRHVRASVDLGILASLTMPSDALWRRVAYEVQPPLLGAIGATPFSSLIIPSPAMMIYAAVYAVMTLAAALIVFERRDL